MAAIPMASRWAFPRPRSYEYSYGRYSYGYFYGFPVGLPAASKLRVFLWPLFLSMAIPMASQLGFPVGLPAALKLRVFPWPLFLWLFLWIPSGSSRALEVTSIPMAAIPMATPMASQLGFPINYVWGRRRYNFLIFILSSRDAHLP